MIMQSYFFVVIKICLLAVCLQLPLQAESDRTVVLISEVDWEQLNPARGDKSPRAGTLWGDRQGTVPTGFLVKFVDGFSSPPHIHNVTYRGVVIDGQIHNDDPSAEKMWMPSGSFWTQPAGEAHITAAKGEHNLAYIEIDRGPYLVHPTTDSFDTGERPVNVDESNIVWITEKNVSLAYLWGHPHAHHLYGALIKLAPGVSAKIEHQGEIFHAVVVKGQLLYEVSDPHRSNLLPGSYFTANTENSVHKLINNTETDSVIYMRTNGKIDISH